MEQPPNSKVQKGMMVFESGADRAFHTILMKETENIQKQKHQRKAMKIW